MNLNFTLTKVLQLLTTTAAISGFLHTHVFASPVNMKAVREEGRRRRRGVTDGLRNGAVVQDSTRSSPHPLNRTLFDPVVGIPFACSFVTQTLCYSCTCTNATVLGSGLREKASKFNDNAGEKRKN